MGPTTHQTLYILQAAGDRGVTVHELQDAGIAQPLRHISILEVNGYVIQRDRIPAPDAAHERVDSYQLVADLHAAERGEQLALA